MTDKLTEAEIEAGTTELLAIINGKGGGPRESVIAIWSAMQSASPRPTGDVVEGDLHFELHSALSDHWLHGLGCQHAPDGTGSNQPICGCGWIGDRLPNVGAARTQWVNHVLEQMRPLLVKWGSNLRPKPASPRPTGDVVEAILAAREDGTMDAAGTIEDLLEVIATLQPADPVEPKVSSDVEAVARGTNPDEWRQIDELRATAAFYRGKIGQVGYNTPITERSAGEYQSMADRRAEKQLAFAARAIATLRASDPSRELVEALTDARNLLAGWHRLNFVDDIQAEAMRRFDCILAQGQSDTKGEGHE